jgi:hypothetical protein
VTLPCIGSCTIRCTTAVDDGWGSLSLIPPDLLPSSPFLLLLLPFLLQLPYLPCLHRCWVWASGIYLRYLSGCNELSRDNV